MLIKLLRWKQFPSSSRAERQQQHRLTDIDSGILGWSNCCSINRPFNSISSEQNCLQCWAHLHLRQFAPALTQSVSQRLRRCVQSLKQGVVYTCAYRNGVQKPLCVHLQVLLDVPVLLPYPCFCFSDYTEWTPSAAWRPLSPPVCQFLNCSHERHSDSNS